MARSGEANKGGHAEAQGKFGGLVGTGTRDEATARGGPSTGSEEESLLSRRGRTWRRSRAVEDACDLGGVGDGRDHAERAAAAQTDRDVELENSGEQTSPSEAGPGGWHGGRRCRNPRSQARSVEHGKLSRHHFFARARALVVPDAGAEAMVVGEDAEVPDLVLSGRRNEADQAGEETVRLEVDVSHASRGGTLEAKPHTAIVELLDGIVGKGRVQEVSAHPFEAFAITTVDDRGSVQRHAERGMLERAWRCNCAFEPAR